MKQNRRLVSPLALLALVVWACADADTVAPSLTPQGRAMYAIDPNENTWNYYSADVTITRAAGTNAVNLQTASTQTSETIVRTLSGSVWSTSVSIAPSQSTGVGSTVPPAMDVATLQTDDEGSYLNAYTRSGIAISITPTLLTDEYPILTPPAGHDPLPSFPDPPPGTSWTRLTNMLRTTRINSDSRGAQTQNVTPVKGQTQNVALVNRNPRAWLVNVISTPKNRAGLHSARISHFGNPIGRLGGLDRYVHQEDGRLTEELVDPASDATAERNIVLNGKLVLHLTQRFTDLGQGRYLLSLIHIESAKPGAPGKPRTTEIAFNNVHLEAK